jgi:hypothetical protein
MGGGHSISAVRACEPVIRAFSLVGRHLSSDSSLVRLFGPLRTILNSYISTDGELVEAVRVVLAGSWSISVGDFAVKTGAVILCSKLTKAFFVSRAFFEMAYDNEIEADRMAVVAIIGLCQAICEIITVTLAQAQSTSAVCDTSECMAPNGVHPSNNEERAPDSGYAWENSVFDGRITWNKYSMFKSQLVLYRYIRSKISGWKLCDSIVMSDDYVRRILGDVNAVPRCVVPAVLNLPPPVVTLFRHIWGGAPQQQPAERKARRLSAGLRFR